MRYSVVLPKIDPMDPEETRLGLERAAILWAKGEQREAIEYVRDASAAATADGQTTRAIALARAATRLSRALETSPSASTLPPTPEQLAPSVPPTPERAAPSVVPATSEDGELVVTIAPSNWDLPSHDALVGHRARRVAIAPGRGPGGTLMVRPLAAGEVAPRGSTVAVLVDLDEEAPVAPRARRTPSRG